MNDVQFMTGKEKELVLKAWKTFIKALKVCDFEDQSCSDYGYFPNGLDRAFNKRLYNHLSGHCGFIAHYNRWGFLAERFSTVEGLTETFYQMENGHVSGDYRDLHQAMMAELNPWTSTILAKARQGSAV